MRRVTRPLRNLWAPVLLAALPVLLLILSSAVSAAGAGMERLVNVHDACDPVTFNAVVGPGTCVRTGGVAFEDFIAQLVRNQFAGAWHFAPGNTTAKEGDTFVAVNRGGEVHTFTEVAEFGGGIIPQLNDLAGTPDEAPECKTLELDDFVAPGDTYREGLDHAGTVRFQCCIHPWMRLEARVIK
jgi:plastocyanin